MRELFKEDKGACIALVKIEKDDGVANEPNLRNGHFTFHEYEGVDFNNRIIGKTNIFVENGTIKNEI